MSQTFLSWEECSIFGKVILLYLGRHGMSMSKFCDRATELSFPLTQPGLKGACKKRVKPDMDTLLAVSAVINITVIELRTMVMADEIVEMAEAF